MTLLSKFMMSYIILKNQLLQALMELHLEEDANFHYYVILYSVLKMLDLDFLN